MIRYNLILMSVSEFIDSFCDNCIFEGCCCEQLGMDCSNAIAYRFNEFIDRI